MNPGHLESEATNCSTQLGRIIFYLNSVFSDVKQFLTFAYKLLVKGGDSCSEGHGFEPYTGWTYFHKYLL